MRKRAETRVVSYFGNIHFAFGKQFGSAVEFVSFEKHVGIYTRQPFDFIIEFSAADFQHVGYLADIQFAVRQFAFH